MAHGSDETGKRHNRLIKKKSLYLLHHAENPGDWDPSRSEATTQLSTLQVETVPKGDEVQLLFL